MKKLIYNLEAHLESHNIHRFYKVWTEKDLFNNIIIYTNFGRVKTKGKIKTYLALSKEEERLILNRIKKRRDLSFSRIGCKYVSIN